MAETRLAGLDGRHGRRPLAARDSGSAARDLHSIYEGAASRPPAIETHKLGPLPQIFADQFGWEEMTATVARVYNSLPPEVRAKTAIFGQNYGQAGAIDLFGPKYGLPPAISGHQSYFLWGPRGYTGESVIVMAGRQQDLESRFADVRRSPASITPTPCPTSISTSSIAAALSSP